MLLIQQNCHQRSYYCLHFLISEYLPRDWKITLACVNNNTILFCTTVFSLLLTQSIWNISNLYNPDKNSIWTYQMICDQICSDPKSDNIFSYYWLLNWLIYFFLSYVEIVHLSQIWEGVGIYGKLIPNWIKSTRARILFPAKFRTKF